MRHNFMHRTPGIGFIMTSKSFTPVLLDDVEFFDITDLSTVRNKNKGMK